METHTLDILIEIAQQYLNGMITDREGMYKMCDELNNYARCTCRKT